MWYNRLYKEAKMDKTKIMEENIGLLYKYCHMHNITDEDRQQEVAYAYCRAIKTYNEKTAHCSLSTYVFSSMRNRLRTLHQINSYLKRTIPEDVKHFSLDQRMQEGSQGNGWDCDYFYDIIGNNDSNFDNVVVQDIIDKIRPKLSRIQCRVFDLLVEGNTRNEVAEILGRSNQAVQQIISRMKDIIMGEVEC